MSTPEQYLKQKIVGVFVEELCHDEVQKCIQSVEENVFIYEVIPRGLKYKQHYIEYRSQWHLNYYRIFSRDIFACIKIGSFRQKFFAPISKLFNTLSSSENESNKSSDQYKHQYYFYLSKIVLKYALKKIHFYFYYTEP